MNGKILTSLLVIGIVIGLTGGATFAYFSDTETSTGNVFSAGTLDLQVGLPCGEVDNPGALFTFSNLKPCQSETMEIGFDNVGSLPGKVTVSLSLADNDDSSAATSEFPTGDVNGDDFAKCLIITAAYSDENLDGDYDDPGEDVLSAWKAYADADGDGKLSIYEMAQKAWTLGPTIPGDGEGGEKAKVKLTIHFDDTEYLDAGYTDVNDLQAEGVAVTITAVLTQT
ncbi:MAG: TasA family protein [Methanocellales archaeon]|nr:TasA family protein [Methanocellales archaeon]